MFACHICLDDTPAGEMLQWTLWAARAEAGKGVQEGMFFHKQKNRKIFLQDVLKFHGLCVTLQQMQGIYSLHKSIHFCK